MNRNRRSPASLPAGWLMLCLFAGPGLSHSTEPTDIPPNLRSVPALPLGALLRQAKMNLEQWRYERVMVSEEKVLVDYHDPTRPGAEHWQLLSIDGRDPTEKERRKYLQERADHAKESEDLVNMHKVLDMVVPGSMELSQETAVGAAYRYRIRSPDGKNEKIYASLIAEMSLNQTSDVPFIEKVSIWNEEALRPVLGLRIDKAGIEFHFSESDGFVLPRRVNVEYRGEVLMLKDIERTFHFELRGFERLNGSSGTFEEAYGAGLPEPIAR